MTSGVRVATAAETADCERATIERGTSSAELMRRAGEGAAEIISKACSLDRSPGLAVFTGSGNNGGDGWVAAGKLAGAGYSVRVIELAAPRSAESRAAKLAALESGATTAAQMEGDEPVVVDALLGTGASGEPRGEIALAIREIERRRGRGARVFAIDLPSGLDATSGDHTISVHADTSISFGTMKRGHLAAREVCGEIVVLDIGLFESSALGALPLLVDAAWVRERVPSIPASAHKGTRKRLAIVGGGQGMAGAAILAGEGALRSGIGLLRIVAAEENALPVHASLPAAIFQPWPVTPDEVAQLVGAVDAVAIGPGLGVTVETRDMMERILLAWGGAAVIDADGLNLFKGDAEALAALLRGRTAAVTPHPAEMARLLDRETGDVVRDRFEIGGPLAQNLDAAVLLKGTPTVVFAPSGQRFVSATGTAALATGGSGDVLTGMAGTLLAQMSAASSSEGERGTGLVAAEAAACAAFVHGRASELCDYVRGTTLDDILRALARAWNEPVPELPGGMLARLPAVA
ncbi:MAG TPA: NAD(P)H-hydrate dehydratase [Gemmatimonadaceae bacterium]|nr:NAD(P)H-hydrate dehydratase [Gemmatimonadaceae bacterium]